LVFLGYFAARTGRLPLDAIGGLNTFVLYFALPCMIFDFAAKAPFHQLLDPALLVVYGLSAVVIVLIALFMARLRGLSVKDGAFGAITAAFPNSGFIGVPLLVSLLGQAAASPVILTIAIDVIFTSSLCLAIAESGRRGGFLSTLATSMKAITRNPMFLSILLGGLFSALDWGLYSPIEAIVRLLGSAASPVALFTIGAVLWRAELLTRKQDYQPRPYMDVVVLKLFVHPLLAMGMAVAVAKVWGLELSPFALSALILTAALPSASNVSLLAERFGADNGRIAKIILITTAASFLSFSGLAGWLGVMD
jgi:malonate transporter and related proteins